MPHKSYRRAAIDLWLSKRERPIVRAGFGRFAWRLASIASVIASIAFLFSYFASESPDDTGFRLRNPWRPIVQHTPLATIEAQGIFVDCALSPDGALLSTASSAQKTIVLQIQDTHSGNLLRTLAKIPQSPLQLHFVAETNDVLAVTPKRVLRFDAATGVSGKSINLPRDVLGKAAFSSDGKSMAIPNIAGKVYLISLMTGRVSRTFTPPRDYVRDPATDTLNLAFSPDSRILAISASANPPYIQDAFPEPAAMLTLWDAASGICLQSTTSGRFVVDSVAFAADGSAVTAVGQVFSMHINDGYFGACMVYNRATGASHTDVFNRDDADVRTNYIAPNGLYFVGASESNLNVWDAATYRLEIEIFLGNFSSGARKMPGDSDPQPIAVHFSDDGSTIAINNTLRIRLFHARRL